MLAMLGRVAGMTPASNDATLTPVTGLYPDIEPFASHRIAVGGGHELYLEECGNPRAAPRCFCMAVPEPVASPITAASSIPSATGWCCSTNADAADPVPHADLTDNTTWHLVADIEAIRERLGIDRWLVFGGSWGSTLALAYAETHPERVRALILRGIFLCREREIRWFYQEGASRVFPDYWLDYLQPIPEAERDDLLSAYHRRLTGDDELARLAAAKAWSLWEGRTANLLPNDDVLKHFGSPRYRPGSGADRKPLLCSPRLSGAGPAVAGRSPHRCHSWSHCAGSL